MTDFVEFKEGDLLIAKKTLKMNQTGAIAIVKGHHYEFRYYYQKLIAVKTLVDDSHYFDLDPKSKDAWSKYFKLKTK